jgi:ligand-binding sensor domain-containing protein
MKELVLVMISWGMLASVVMGQTPIGLPAIKNYKNSDYRAATEIWDIHQDKNGILYFANNEGLMSFNGNYWKIYPLPNKAAIKSLAIDDSGRIYVGGQDEIGYFSPGQNGILSYHSLKELLPAIARQFADIWNIIVLKEEVFFRTNESIFQLKNNKIRTFDCAGGWRLMTRADSRIFAEDKLNGLLVFKDGQWQEPCGKRPTADLHITAVMDYKKDTLLVITLKNGLYLLYGSTLAKKSAPIDKLLSHDLVTGAQQTSKGRYALRTNSSGVFITDTTGKLIQRFSNIEGLQNNNILTVFPDHDKNLWLGLENGVAFIDYNTSVKHIYPVSGNQLKSNAVKIFDQKLFIGTSNGLYSVPLDLSQKDFSSENGVFTEVANTKGQVWSLAEINHELLLGHQDGAFVIRKNNAIPLLTRHGVWGFKIISPQEIIAGTYTGLERITYENGNFKAEGKFNDQYESLNVLAIDNSPAIWASHPYRGVFRTPIPANRKMISHHTHYTQKDGLPSDLNNEAYFIKNKMVVATGRGIYEYNAGSGTFRPSPYYKQIFHENSVEYLTEDRDGNTWFVSNQRAGVIDYSKPSATEPFSVIYFPELTGQTVRGAAYIYPYDRENVFIGSNNGIFHLNYNNYIKSDTSLKVLLSAVKAISERDSLIFGGYNCTQPVPSFPKHLNSFHFEYSAPVYAQKDNVGFTYKLVGFDEEWSEWSAKTEKDYTNLPYGTYTFMVRASNNLGNTSSPVSYTFTVRPAWYQTTWAYLMYVLMAACLLYYIYGRQQKRFALQQKKYEEEQERLNYLYSLELDRKEKGIIALQNEKLEGELQFKNKELATVTMHLVERSGILLNIKQELMAVVKKLNLPDGTREFRNIFKMMNDSEKKDDDWNRFAIHFDQVHNNFLSTLKTKFSQLSPTDLKLCAYLRLNLSSKEIAQLLNISLKGVEVSRYRLRKKLNLPAEINLYDFLIEATSQESRG